MAAHRLKPQLKPPETEARHRLSEKKDSPRKSCVIGTEGRA